MGIIGFQTTVEVVLLNIETGAQERRIVLYRASGTPIGSGFIGVGYDGQNIVSCHNVGGNDILSRIQLEQGANLSRMETATPLNNNLLDICCDGHHWWGLFSGNFRKFSDWKYSVNFGPTITHGLSTARGIMFVDGKIGVIAA